jgi:pyruvate kinase
LLTASSADLVQDYEVDFISLSYTRTVEDVREAREFLDAVGLSATKIFAKLESRQVRFCVLGALKVKA